jgi:hypothetical protein
MNLRLACTGDKAIARQLYPMVSGEFKEDIFINAISCQVNRNGRRKGRHTDEV